MGQKSGDNRGDERGMQERLHRAGTLGIDMVQAVDRLIQFDAQFHLPDIMPPQVEAFPR
jgi:hypothetical protein